MTAWTWTEFVPEDRSCGRKAFESDLDRQNGSILIECSKRLADLTARFGPSASHDSFNDTGPFDGAAAIPHAWFFSLEEQFTMYSKRFDFVDGELKEGRHCGSLDAMTFTIFFRDDVSREEFGLDLLGSD